ncbi:MAG TPA: DUF411 domain-containing protein [Methyloceanibacter sp.]|jgi:hypothetical protein|nr:DUF411 domain-containing protein [Methyloceanibacter sp.]
MTPRSVLAFFLAITWIWPDLAAAEGRAEVWKSPSCECCGAWVEHLQTNGFDVKVNAAIPSMLDRIKREAGIGEQLAACHTAKIGAYVIEGHVPAADIERLLAEQPDALGLTVPGMPVGSPGMEQDGKTEPYDVLLIKKDGTTEIFARH